MKQALIPFNTREFRILEKAEFSVTDGACVAFYDTAWIKKIDEKMYILGDNCVARTKFNGIECTMYYSLADLFSFFFQDTPEDNPFKKGSKNG